MKQHLRLIHRRTRMPQRGQGMVEFALVLPFLMMLILGAIEFGFMFNSNISLEYASREGARVASALVNGGGPLTCPGDAQVPKVDPAIIEAVNRVLTSSGSPLIASQVTEIRIFQANASGGEVAGNVNIWLPTPGAGPVVDGKALDFSQSTVGWSVCTRTYLQPSPDSVGVGIRYVYKLQTPFANLFGKTTLTMYDKTIMAMNPTN